MAYKEMDETESMEGAVIRTGLPFWKPPGTDDGKWVLSRVRIMPTHADHPNNKWYEYVATHGNLPGAGRPVMCPHKMFDEPCPACKISVELRQAGQDKLAKQMASTWRGLVNVVPLDANGVPTGDTIFIWSMPSSLVENLNSKIEELPTGERKFTNVKNGRDVFVRRKGTGEFSKYEIAFAPQPSPVHPKIMEMLEDTEVERLHLLTTVYDRTDAAKISAFLNGPSRTDPFENTGPFDPFENVVEGSVRELPAPANVPVFEDDEEDEPEEVTIGRNTAPDAVAEARRKLAERLAGTA